MKKALCVLLTALFTLSCLAGCGGKPSDSKEPASPSSPSQENNTPAPSTEQRTLHIAGHTRMYPDEESYWQELADKFTKENPDVKVEINWNGTFEDSIGGLQAARLAGEEIDIFSVGAKNIRGGLIQAGLCTDLTDLIAPYTDRWVDGQIDGCTIDGRIWYLPMGSIGTVTFYYNKDMFDELNLEIPQTYDELVAVCAAIREKKGITPILQQGSLPTYWPMWFMETYAQTSGNRSAELTRAFLAGEYDFNTDAEVEAFRLLRQFFDDGLLDSDSLNTDADGMRAAFAQGKSAMFFGGTWEYTNAEAAVDGAFEMGVFEFPLMVEGAEVQHGSGSGQSLIVPSFCNKENYDIIMRFLEFFSRPENCADIATAAADLLPCVKGIKTETNPVYEYINTHHVNHLAPYLDWIWPAELTNIFASDIPAVMAGYMTPEQAVEDIRTNYKRMLAEGYVYKWWDEWTEEDWANVTPAYIPESYAS